MPMLRDSETTRSAIAVTAASVAPLAAAAPAIFSTHTVAAVPRRPAPSPIGRAASSSTITVATGTPSLSASSAPMPKFMTSPV